MKTSIITMAASLFGIASSIASPLKVGEAAPDFTLEDSAGTSYSLSKQLKQSKIALLFYRSGDW